MCPQRTAPHPATKRFFGCNEHVERLAYRALAAPKRPAEGANRSKPAARVLTER